ncbi:MAG: hypothetical protein GY793_03345 [Proteobacteria bacterium]|nr:hypothetical protein [Pseudomonadota bacterium]
MKDNQDMSNDQELEGIQKEIEQEAIVELNSLLEKAKIVQKIMDIIKISSETDTPDKNGNININLTNIILTKTDKEIITRSSEIDEDIEISQGLGFEDINNIEEAYIMLNLTADNINLYPGREFYNITDLYNLFGHLVNYNFHLTQCVLFYDRFLQLLDSQHKDHKINNYFITLLSEFEKSSQFRNILFMMEKLAHEFPEFNVLAEKKLNEILKKYSNLDGLYKGFLLNYAKSSWNALQNMYSRENLELMKSHIKSSMD